MMRLTFETVRPYVHAALKAWSQTDGTPRNLLADFLLVKAKQRANRLHAPAIPQRQATNTVLSQGLTLLEDELQAVLRLRFIQGLTIKEVAQQLTLSDDQVNRRQRQAIQELAHWLYEQELGIRQETVEAMTAVLPPATYNKLFGLETEIPALVDRLIAPDDPWLVTLVGVGGIGKTALADAVTRRVIQQFYFEKVVWLQAGQHPTGWRHHLPDLTLDGVLSALTFHLELEDVAPTHRLRYIRRALKAIPHLVIIDNLETETDTTYLLAHLMDLAQPSKFLVTSRTQPPPEMAVFIHPVPELPATKAMDLLRHQIRLPPVEEADLHRIYTVTGGNPLALKLVGGLLSRRLPLAHILTHLDATPLATGERLYTRLYAQTWQTLSQPAQTLLPCLLLVSDHGATLPHMEAISGLDEKGLWTAVTELLTRSLLMAQGSLHQPHYRLHRLTATFLHTEQLPQVDLTTAIERNIHYWQGQLTGTLTDIDVSNLIQAILWGWENDEKRPLAIQLTLTAFPYIERSTHSHSWIALLHELLPTCELSSIQCQLLNQLGLLYRRTRQLTEAVNAHQQSQRLAERLGDNLLLALANHQLGADYYHQHQYALARQLGEQAVAGLAKAEPHHLATACNQVGLTAWRQGELIEAKEYLEQAKHLWQIVADPIEKARTTQNLAIVETALGHTETAMAHYQAALALLQPTPYLTDKVRVWLSLGTLYYGQSQWLEAESVYRKAVDTAVTLPNEYLSALATSNLGWVLLAQGQGVEAEEYFRQAVTHWAEAEEPISQANSWQGLGEALAKQGKTTEARTIWQKALGLLAGFEGNGRAEQYREEIQQHLKGAIT